MDWGEPPALMARVRIHPKLVRAGFRFLFGTQRVEVVHGERLDQAQRAGGAAVIYTWHGLLYLPVYALRDRGIYGLVSPSRDGQFFADLFRSFGWKVVEGSSRQKPVEGLMKAKGVLRQGGVLAIVPDGPVGPAFQVKPGMAFLGSVLNVPLIPVGVAFRHAVTLKSWDQAKLPIPFSRACLYFGEPIRLPRLARSQRAAASCELGARLEACIEEARQRL